MSFLNLDNTSVRKQLFAPIHSAYSESNRKYDCHSISDLEFAELGVSCCLSLSTTGHEFLQDHAQHTADFIGVSHFFKALKSERRLENLISLNQLLGKTFKSLIPDAFMDCLELDDFDIYAGDGHGSCQAS